MGNKDFNNITYDYYSNTSSYVKMILDMLPESKVSMSKKNVIKELYNFFLNQYSDDKIREIAKVSSMFREIISVQDLDTVSKNVDYIYNNFLERIIFDSVNRAKIFNIMNECMKVYVGYYSEYILDDEIGLGTSKVENSYTI